jgi:hypothetical protein
MLPAFGYNAQAQSYFDKPVLHQSQYSSLII